MAITSVFQQKRAGWSGSGGRASRVNVIPFSVSFITAPLSLVVCLYRSFLRQRFVPSVCANEPIQIQLLSHAVTFFQQITKRYQPLKAESSEI